MTARERAIFKFCGSLAAGGKRDFCSQDLVPFFQVSRDTLTRSLSSMVKKGYVEMVSQSPLVVRFPAHRDSIPGMTFQSIFQKIQKAKALYKEALDLFREVEKDLGDLGICGE